MTLHSLGKATTNKTSYGKKKHPWKHRLFVGHQSVSSQMYHVAYVCCSYPLGSWQAICIVPPRATAPYLNSWSVLDVQGDNDPSVGGLQIERV